MSYSGMKKQIIIKGNKDTFPMIIKAAQLRIDNPELWHRLIINKKCPECGGTLVFREGCYGEFLGCSNYPRCKYTANISKNTE